MNVGLTTTSSVSPPSCSTKSQAVRSAIVLDRGYGGRPGVSGSVQSASVYSAPRFGGVTDRRKRRGQHDTSSSGVACGPQEAQRAVPGGNDHLVGIVGLDHWRGDVVDLLAVGRRRHRYTGTCSFYRCWTPEPVPLTRLIAIAVTRWRIEEDHQLVKQAVGLDSGQVIRWRSGHRWSALCLLACIYLAVATAVQRNSHAGPETGLIAITIPELVRLLRDTAIPPPCRDTNHRQP